jgi:hypothetical protein
MEPALDRAFLKIKEAIRAYLEIKVAKLPCKFKKRKEILLMRRNKK